jgi:hypothetical protein
MRQSSAPVLHVKPHLPVRQLRTRLHRAHRLRTQLPAADHTVAAVADHMAVVDHTAAAAITAKLQQS